MPKVDAYENGHSTLLRIDRIYRHRTNPPALCQLNANDEDCSTRKNRDFHSFSLDCVWRPRPDERRWAATVRLVFTAQNNYIIFIPIWSDSNENWPAVFAPNAVKCTFASFASTDRHRYHAFKRRQPKRAIRSRAFKSIRNYHSPLSFYSQFSLNERSQSRRFYCSTRLTLQLFTFWWIVKIGLMDRIDRVYYLFINFEFKWRGKG